MANALAYDMPRDENPLSPIPSAPTFGGKPKPQMNAATVAMPQNKLKMKTPQAAVAPQMAPRPNPRASASPNALAMAFGPSQQKPDGMYMFMDTLQRTMDPERAQARETKMSEDQQTKLKQGLAFVQQMKAIPEDQRMAFAQQGVGQFGLGNIQIPADGLSDAELDKGIATLSAQLGQGPAAKEFQYFQGQDGAISQVDKGTGDFRQINPGTPKPQKTWDEVNGRIISTDDPTKVLADYSDQDGGRTKGETFTDASGQVWLIDPYTGEAKTVEGVRGRVPGSDGGGSGDTYRAATPQDLEAWGIPRGTPVKINNRTGEPQVISGAKPASEYNQTEIRGFRDKADGLYILQNAIGQYVDTLEKMGGPQLLDTPLNAENVQAIRSAHGLITAAMKQAEALGALDAGVQNLVNSIISDPVGWGTIGKSTKSIKAQAEEIGKGIDFKLSRIPEDYRYGSTGAAPPQATPNQPPPFNGSNFDAAPPPGLPQQAQQAWAKGTPAMRKYAWDRMSPAQKASAMGGAQQAPAPAAPQAQAPDDDTDALVQKWLK